MHGLGHVHMAISCAVKAGPTFDRALALLHSFWYDRALSAFDDVIAIDPKCAIAYWGAAMTFNHPLWSDPTAADVASARRYIARAQTASERTAREARYLADVTILFGEGDPATKAKRDVAYRDAMETTYNTYRDDETALFYALAIDALIGQRNAPEQIAKAAALADGVLKRQPHHPGALHYLIHIYDREGYAERGLPVAREYARSAPSIPHALHMPSHIFLRLGLWDEAARADAASFRASEIAVERAGEPTSKREFHNLTFEQYARLQMGQYTESRREALIASDQYEENLRLIARGGLPKGYEDQLRALAYETSMMLGNYMLTTGDYRDVARLPKAAEYPDPFITLCNAFVRASAGAAGHDRAAVARAEQYARSTLASAALERLPELRRMRETAVAEDIIAVAAQARGNRATAFSAARRATHAEDELASLTQPTLPAVPAHELYGSLLFEGKRYAEAHREYIAALKRTPRRAAAVLGLAQSAREIGATTESVDLFSEYARIRQGGDTTGKQPSAQSLLPRSKSTED